MGAFPPPPFVFRHTIWDNSVYTRCTDNSAVEYMWGSPTPRNLSTLLFSPISRGSGRCRRPAPPLYVRCVQVLPTRAQNGIPALICSPWRHSEVRLIFLWRFSSASSTAPSFSTLRDAFSWVLPFLRICSCSRCHRQSISTMFLYSRVKRGGDAHLRTLPIHGCPNRNVGVSAVISASMFIHSLRFTSPISVPILLYGDGTSCRENNRRYVVMNRLSLFYARGRSRSLGRPVSPAPKKNKNKYRPECPPYICDCPHLTRVQESLHF